MKDEEDLFQWVDTITPFVVRDDFHKEFKATKVLGEGSFAKVFRVRNQRNGMILAAKAYLKEDLVSSALEALHAEIQALKLLIGEECFI